MRETMQCYYVNKWPQLYYYWVHGLVFEDTDLILNVLANVTVRLNRAAQPRYWELFWEGGEPHAESQSMWVVQPMASPLGMDLPVPIPNWLGWCQKSSCKENTLRSIVDCPLCWLGCCPKQKNHKSITTHLCDSAAKPVAESNVHSDSLLALLSPVNSTTSGDLVAPHTVWNIIAENKWLWHQGRSSQMRSIPPSR